MNSSLSLTLCRGTALDKQQKRETYPKPSSHCFWFYCLFALSSPCVRSAGQQDVYFSCWFPLAMALGPVESGHFHPVWLDCGKLPSISLQLNQLISQAITLVESGNLCSSLAPFWEVLGKIHSVWLHICRPQGLLLTRLWEQFSSASIDCVHFLLQECGGTGQEACVGPDGEHSGQFWLQQCPDLC